MNGLVVRRAVGEDATALARCHMACWHEAYQGIVPDDVLDARTTDLDGRRDRWASALEGESSTYVAAAADAIVGFVSTGPSRDEDLSHLVEMYALYVRAYAYGSGLADRLTRSAIGDSPAYLWVLAANPRALAYYRKIGFRADGHTKVYEGFGDALAVRLVRA